MWIFSKTNAWAVGEIYLNDSTGQINMSDEYNASRWNGITWSLMKIPTASYGGTIDNSSIYTIFAFGENDIWTFSIGGSYLHWNGTTWTTQFVAEHSGGGNKLWGTSSSNLFLVGTDGSTSRYNGSVWIKMTSNTTVDLQDIYGIDATHIWATGTTISDGHCVVLQCNGTSWTTLYDSNTQPDQSKYQFGTVWTNTSSSIYLDGGSGTHILALNNLDFGLQIKTGLTYVGSCIRAVNQNDIFDVSIGGEVAHYNGSSWHFYTEFQSLNGGNAWWTSVFLTGDMVVIGGWFTTALNGFPVVNRGYR